MNSSPVKRILILTALAAFVISTLYYCDRKSYAASLNPFNRNYQKDAVVPRKKIKLSFDPGEILDIPKPGVFIINSKDRTKLYWVDLGRDTTIAYAPPTVKRKNIDKVTAAWYTDSTLYVLNGNGRSIIKKKGFPVYEQAEEITLVNFTVVKTLAYHGTKLIVRKTADSGTRCNLAIYDAVSNTYVQDEWPKDKFNGDCLSTDGGFAYDGKNAIYYINLYNSRVVKFDSSFRMAFESATIDRTKTFPAVRFDSVEKSYNFFSPHRLVNYCAAADGERLFVMSALPASNDLQSVWSKNNPLDVYSSVDGTYMYSYHLQDVDINNVQDIKKREKDMFIISGNELLIYHL